MRFFDAHCDTVMNAEGAGYDFLAGDARGHIDLPRLLEAGSCVQLFAVFAPAVYYPDRNLSEMAERMLAQLHEWAAGSGGRFKIARTGGDIRSACDEDGVYGLLGLEGADPLGDDPEAVRRFYALGVRHVIPAWGDNAFSGTSMYSGGPLTERGLRLVELCQELGMMVDVSHLSDAAFWQVCESASGPFVASHSNCRELCTAPRNLTDEMIRALADRGGVVGITLAPEYLQPEYQRAHDSLALPVRKEMLAETDRARRSALRDALRAELARIPLPGVEWVTRHVHHAIQIAGEDAVGLGGDLDGIPAGPVGITGIESYPMLAEMLAASGLTERQVERVCWRNMARAYAEVLPA